ncbi:CLUMA_CG005351, isoform A [Clunio marinus]|uniref:CLUMA_CG005351, isoform A n=1 Tax=Clunio marinus TaxID=568069 RepID=A0A1J1HZZ5_9DIPT|nr:CLUMA_CG005351, isoform A [Clunio marinus]
METLLEPESNESVNKSGSFYVISDDELVFEVPTHILILLSLLYGSISFIAVIGNSLVIWIVITTRQMHTVTNFFIGNLAMADVIIGLFSIPFQFQAAVLQRWDLPRFMCPFCPFIQILSVNVSIFTLTAIAIDRHKAILNPLRARSSKQASKIIIGFIWMVALFFASPISYGLRVVDLMVQYEVKDNSTNVTLFTPNITKPFCQIVNLNDAEMLVYRYTLVLVQYIIPVCVISFVYIQMAIKLWGSKTPGNAQDVRDFNLLKNKKKVIKMLVIVVVLFCVAWFPLQMYNILQVTYPEINEYRHINIIWLCFDWLAMSNSCYNPFIYGIYNEKFKREFYKRFSFFHKFGFGRRFYQSTSGMAGATTMTDYHNDKTMSTYNTRASISHHLSHNTKKSCCVRNENLFRSGNGVVYKNSYITDDDDDNYTITSTPFIENNRNYNTETEGEDFEFSKII